MNGWASTPARPKVVFLSSVRRGLEEHRDAAAGLLAALGHQIVRFEDFAAQDIASRTACMEAARASELFILLLGAHYGESQPQTGLSATHEEYKAARAAGVPMLVFVQAGVETDPQQLDFADLVGDYVAGRLWKEFLGPGALVEAIGAALRQLPDMAEPVEWWPVDGLNYQPVHANRNTPGAPGYTPILEVHILPGGQVPLRSASAARGLAELASVTMRRTGFLGQDDPVEVIPDEDSVHLRRPSQPKRSGSGAFGGVTKNRYRGVRLAVDGANAAYSAIPTDGLGGLIDEDALIGRLLELVRPLMDLLPQAERLAVTGAIISGHVLQLGNPSDLGRRNHGRSSFGSGDIVLPADRMADRSALQPDPMASAKEVATRLIERLAARM